MKPKFRLNPLLLSLAAFAFAHTTSSAANYTWDLSSTAGIQTGDGNWNTTGATNWSTDGITLSNWLQTSATVALHTATFAGADGTHAITLGTNVAAQSLTFSNSGYTLSAAAAQNVTVNNTGNGVVLVASGKTATIGNNANVLLNAASNTGTRIDLATGGTFEIASGGTVSRTGQITTGFSTTGGTLGFMGSGTVNVAGTLSFNVATPVANGGIVLAANNGNNNVLNVNGGTVSSNSTINGIALTAAGGNPASATSGILTINSGLISTTGTAGVTSGISLANGTNTTGTVNLNGGTISTFQINSNYYNGSNVLTTGGTSNFNFNSGTLKAIANNTAFMAGLTAANVKAGGAVVNSNGFNITIGQALLHDSALGVTPDGGFTKNGGGILTLSGGNTYTGATSVTEGTLVLTGSLASAITVGNSATLSGTGSTTGSITFNAGSSLTVNPADGLAANGVSFAGSTTLTITTALTTGNTYNLIDFGSGSLSGTGNIIKTTRGTFGTSGSILQFTAGAILTDTWNTTSGTWEIGISTPWTNSGDNQFWNGDTVVFDDTPGSDASVTLSGSLLPAAVTVNNSTVAYTLSGSGSIGGTSSLTKSGGGILNLGTSNNYSGATSINAGTLNLTGGISGTAVTVANGANLNVSSTGTISGSSSLSTSGAVVLAGTNTYTGTTTIGTGGSLQLGDGITDGSITGTSNVTNNAVLRYNLGSAQTAAYPISGPGSLTKLGFGALTLTGANGYSGGTIIDEGQLIAGVTGLNGGSITINPNGTLTFTGNNQVSTSTLTGSGAILNNTANTIVINGDHTGFTGTFTHNAAANNTQFNTAVSASQNASYSLINGEIIFAGAGDYTVRFGALSSNAGNIRGSNSATGTATVEVGNLDGDSLISGTFTNGGTKIVSLQKVGAGKLTLAGGANYTGPTIVNAGTLDFTTTAKTLGSSAFTIANSAGLSVKTAAVGTTMLPTGSLTLGSSNLTFDFNSLNPTVAQISTGALAVNGSVNVGLLNVNSLVTGSYKLIDYTTIGGSGSFPGGSFSVGNRGTATIVNNAIDTSIDLVVTSDSLKWTGLDSGQWLAGSTGSNKNWKLAVSGTSTDYIDDDHVLFDDSAAGTKNVVIDSGSVFPASTTFNTATNTYTLSGASGIASGSLTKSGAGSVTLTNANFYTGATTINAGTLQLGDGTLDGTISSTSSVTDNGTLAYNLAGDQTAPYLISGSGTLAKTGAGVLTLTGANTYSGGSSINGGALTLTGNGTLGTGNIAVATGATLNIDKNLALVATIVTGAGAITNTGTFTNTGDFTGFSGTFTHNSAFASAGFNSATATSQTAAYQIASDQGASQGMIAAGNGDYTLKLGSLSGVANSLFRGGNTATGTTILEIGNLGTNTEFAGSLNNGVTKIIGLTKVGGGTLTLSGTSNYTASTLVNGGALNVTGSIAAGSAVTVNPGATLKGTGTVAGSITASGTIAPGTSAGTLTTGPATLTGTLAIEIDGGTGDKLVSTGAINFSAATLTVTTLSGGFTEASYVIAEGTSITGPFINVPSGYSVNIVSGGVGQQAVLTSNAASSFANWATTNGAGGQDPDQDHDGDGVDNGVEYFMGETGSTFTANPPVVVSGANRTVTWPKVVSFSGTYQVQTSPDLVIWSPATGVTDNGTSVVYTFPPPSGKTFVRLSVDPD